MGSKKRKIPGARRKLDMAAAHLVIVSKLNMPHSPAEVRRITELLENLYRAKIRHQLLAGSWQQLWHDTELPHLLRAIKHQLLAYDWTPTIPSIMTLTVVPAWRTEAEKLASAEPDYGSDPLIPLFGEVHSAKDISAKEWEQQAAWYLLTRGHWERYRRCLKCSRWYYAAADYQKFCDRKCRQNWAAQTEEFREKRKRYMARKRAEQKAEDQRALKLARRVK